MICSSWKSSLALVRSLLLVGLAAVVAPAWGTDMVSTDWAATTCASVCHGGPVNSSGISASAVFPYGGSDYPRILSMTLLKPATPANQVASKMASYCSVNNGGFGTYMCSNYSSYLTGATPTTLIAAYTYLLAARQTVVSTSSLTFGGLTRRGFTNPTAQSFTIKNYRSLPVAFSYTLAGDFSVSSACTTQLPAATATDPGTCTFSVSFAPGSSVTAPAISRPMAFTFVSTGTAGTTLPPKPDPYSVTLNGTADVPPVVSAGSNQTVITANAVTLAGTATDANGQALTPTWSFNGPLPTGSTAVLLNANTLSPSFTPNVGGTYNLTLSVTDGTFTVTSNMSVNANTRPIANAGPNQAVLVPATVTLDGSASADPDGNAITYLWSLSRPAGSSASLSNATAQKPTFVADVGGPYTATLTVSDGSLTSTVSPVLISANTRPVANAGPSQSVTTAAVVQLNGSGSQDADGNSLSYAWSLGRPVGSIAVLSSATSVAPAFTADVAGLYTATLTVNDGLVNSVPANVAITASVGNAAPIARATAPATAVVGATITFDGSTSSDADGNPLTYAWTLSRPAGSSAALSNATAQRPTLVADVAGSYTATLVVNDGTVNSPTASASVTVSPPAPVFAINSTSLPFSAAAASTTTASAVISNPGTAPLVLNSLSFSGTQAGEYSLAAGNGCVAALSIAAGGNCTLVVSFSPLAAGSRTATLSITHNAVASPQLVALQGTASAAPQGKIELSALTLAFDDTVVTSSATLPVTIRNTGTLALNFTAFSIGGASGAEFSQSGACSPTVPLAILAECTVNVVFRPTAAGPHSASLTVQSDASNGAATLSLTGIGLPAPAPVVTLTPTPTLEFGAQTVSGLYPPRQVLLTNSGNADLIVSNIVVTGTAYTASGTSNCPTTLGAGSSCAIVVSFLAPSVAGFDGNVRVTSNAVGSPHAVGLHGTGTTAAVPVLRWVPAITMLNFGNVSSGAISAVQSATLKNEGPGGVRLSFFNAVGPDGFAFSVDAGTCPLEGPLFEGTTCRIDIRFAPASAGNKRGEVQVASSGSAPPPLALTGTGLSGPAPALGMTATTLDLGSSTVGSASLPATLVLTSNGSGILNVSSIELTGPYAIQSTTCPAAPFTLNSGVTCSIALKFQPTSAGVSTGNLRVVSDASPAVRDIALKGNGEAAREVSSGGCALGSGDGDTSDPLLWLLICGASVCLLVRRRRSPAAEMPGVAAGERTR